MGLWPDERNSIHVYKHNITLILIAHYSVTGVKLSI